MDLAQAVILALIQGAAEFLPISSSGHLILVPELLGWPDQGLGFDIAVHLGTLAAVIVYFRRDLAGMAMAVVDRQRPEFRLVVCIVVASVPLGAAGLVFSGQVEGALRSPGVIAASTAGFGVLLWLADRSGRGSRAETSLGWRDVAAIGFGQALALIPGTSRSGITMTVALAMGLSRQAAGRFSFLLAIPAIAMAALWQSMQFLSSPEPVAWSALALAAALAAAVAFATIALFLSLIERIGMAPFAIYRVLLGGALVYLL